MIRNAMEPWHLAVLAVLFMLLFGAKRLPDTAKALGESMNIFKKSIKDNGEAKPESKPAELT